MKTILTFLLLITTSVLTAQSFSDYKILHRHHLIGNAGWDYLAIQESTGRLFISHGNQVQVLEPVSGQLLATITGLQGVHGIAFAEKFHKGFITNGKDSTVTVFNLGTFEKIAQVKVSGANPDALLFDPYSDKVFVFNGRSANATVIDAATNNVVSTIPLDGKPEFGVSDGNGNIFLNIEDKSEIAVIAANTYKVIHYWPINPGEEPSGLAIDLQNHRLFSVCDKMMVILDSDNGKVITSLTIGDRVDGVTFDPELKRAYSSNGEGTLSIIREIDKDHFEVMGNLQTQAGARTITIDKSTHHLFLSTAEYGETPAKTDENPHPRPAILPGTFTVLEIGFDK
ncbi:MAG: YncE family protein [Bacteroidetes bacterium]|nr:YncE family protein [Bacteroidota bacterium]